MTNNLANKLHFSELTGAGQDATHVARLQARSMFKDIRAEAEEYIYKKLVFMKMNLRLRLTSNQPCLSLI